LKLEKCYDLDVGRDNTLTDRVTQTLSKDGDAPSVSRFRVTVLDGATAGRSWQSDKDRCTIGFHELNDVVLEDATVSRFHCEIRVDARRALVHDLGSRNGTILDGVTVDQATLKNGSLLRIGKLTLRFEVEDARVALPLSPRQSFGPLVGGSAPMRASFTLLERAAASDVTVLLEGETGTGKGEAAEAIHDASARREHRFIVVDCGAIPENLLESELFGHEKGAFTGADQKRVGAFEEAAEGTIFLDEIGELPLDLQPALLRVLENREIRRVGSNQYRPANVRVIAATNRDLRAEVNAGRFRPDLYFRLAVLRIPMPPLRERPEDIPAIVDKLLEALRAPEGPAATLRAPAFLAGLQRAAWPGNIRELRNHLEQRLLFQDLHESPADAAPPSLSIEVDAHRRYSEARRAVLDRFDATYLAALLREHQGKVSAAAAAAGMTRMNLYRLLKRCGLKT
jgi:DNA-binding NtrC family response regulator